MFVFFKNLDTPNLNKNGPPTPNLRRYSSGITPSLCSLWLIKIVRPLQNIMPAKIVQINVNPKGGVPKFPVGQARLGFERVEGDKQRNLKFHGGPTRAVCLYSLEIIEKLRAEGHPIESGWAGENLLVSGLNWDAMVPGVRLQIGEAQIEITSYVTPCYKISAAFSDGDFKRIGQKQHPGWSRIYGRVLVEATVKIDDEVAVLPNEPDA